MDITPELLDELEQKAKAAVPGCCGKMIPTGVEYGGQREMMCCEAWQQAEVAIDPLDLIALVEHIRSLSERLERAEKDAGRYQALRHSLSGEPLSTTTDMPCVFVPLHPELTYSPEGLDEAIDAAIAQEAGHE